uniref:Uncharacterized protein n=1 Tax=Anguilla anguilla TaxID=7936 RepID=A0A0E9W8A0_ANGAN
MGAFTPSVSMTALRMSSLSVEELCSRHTVPICLSVHLSVSLFICLSGCALTLPVLTLVFPPPC